MAFQMVKREDQMVASKQSYIILRENTIAFNSIFFKEANLNRYTYVKTHVDPDNYKIGFEFHNNSIDEDSLSLYTDSKSKNNRNISTRQIYKKYKWIDKISKLPNNALKRFKPKYDNIEKKWVITLIPTFEYSAKTKDVPNNINGIYRYKKSNEVVYIGKGKIRSRANSPERKNWIFDTIEYSIIEDSKKQSEYESYWLDVYSRETGGLPIYNKISGQKK